MWSITNDEPHLDLELWTSIVDVVVSWKIIILNTIIMTRHYNGPSFPMRSSWNNDTQNQHLTLSIHDRTINCVMTNTSKSNWRQPQIQPNVKSAMTCHTHAHTSTIQSTHQHVTHSRDAIRPTHTMHNNPSQARCGRTTHNGKSPHRCTQTWK